MRFLAQWANIISEDWKIVGLIIKIRILLQKLFPRCVVLAAVATFSALKARVSIKYPVDLVKIGTSLTLMYKTFSLYLREVSI